MGIDFPLAHPAVCGAQRVSKRQAHRHPPMAPLEFAYKLDEYAADNGDNKVIRFYCAALFLQVMASLRFSDTAQIAAFFVTKTLVGGAPINQKAKGGTNFQGQPRRGQRSKGAWVNPLLTYWEKVWHKPGKQRSLYPFVSSGWECDVQKMGPVGVIQASFTRIEIRLGVPPLIKLQSHRCWFSTFTSQLLHSKEERSSLGRRMPDSTTPDRYDRAECATELHLRDKIIEKIQSGWRPAGAFELPIASRQGRELVDSSDESTSEHQPHRRCTKSAKI